MTENIAFIILGRFQVFITVAKEYDLLGYLYSKRTLPAFQRTVLSPSSESKSTVSLVLKVQAAHFSETSVKFHKAVWCMYSISEWSRFTCPNLA